MHRTQAPVQPGGPWRLPKIERVRQIVPAGPGWYVALPIWENGDMIRPEVWLDPIVAWACCASYSGDSDLPSLTNSDPIIGGEMYGEGTRVAIKRPDGKFVVPEDCTLNDEAELVEFWREAGR